MIFSTLLRPHDRMRRELDAYADGELAADRLARFEAHLDGCADCARAVETARVLKTALKAMPERDAPRSFVLTPAMARAAAAPRSPAPGQRRAARLAGPMQFAAAAATAVLAVVAVVDVWPGGSGTDDDAQPASLAVTSDVQGQPADSKAAAGTVEVAASPTVAPRALSTPAAGGAAASSADDTPAPASTGGDSSNDYSAPPATAAVADEAAREDVATGELPAVSAFAAPAASVADEDDGFPTIRLVQLGLLAFLAADAALMVVRRMRRRSR